MIENFGLNQKAIILLWVVIFWIHQMGEVIQIRSAKNYTILALDQGTYTGWAYGTNLGEYGSINFKSDNRIESWIKYNKWLQEKIEEIKPLCVVVEQPFFRGKSSDYLFHFSNQARLLAHIHKLAFLEVHGMTIKRHAGVKKGKLNDKAKQRGWVVKNDHEADALFSLDYVKENASVQYEGEM